MNFSHLSQVELDIALQSVCLQGQLDMVKYFLESPELTIRPDIVAQSNFCFVESLANGYVEIAQYLVSYDEVKNHPHFHMHKERAFGKALAKENLNAIKFLIFQLDIERTQQVENYFSDLGLTEIEDWFKARELNKELNINLAQKISHEKKVKI